jgi:crossover junction endodeoxyribonuclease RuvC
MTVIGLDLSLTSTGVAVAEAGRIVHTQAVKSTGKRGDALTERERRIYDIVNRVQAAVLRHDARLVVIEAPSFGSVGGSAHDRSGLWWGIVRMLGLRNIPVAQVAPTQRAKYATGNGRAEKKVVHAEAKELYGLLSACTDDEGDAAILAAIGSRYLGEPCEPDSDYRLELVKTLTWPM